jgi:hypothetical protein
MAFRTMSQKDGFYNTARGRTEQDRSVVRPVWELGHLEKGWTVLSFHLNLSRNVIACSLFHSRSCVKI